MTPELLAALEHARAAKRPVVVATKLPEGEQRLLPDHQSAYGVPSSGLVFSAPLRMSKMPGSV